MLKDFAEHEDAFDPIKSDADLIGDVKRFGGFLLEVPDGVDVTAYNTVLIWCETFSAFLTAARDQ